MGGAPWARGHGGGWTASQFGFAVWSGSLAFETCWIWESRCLNSSGMGFSSFLALSLGRGAVSLLPPRISNRDTRDHAGSTHSGQVQSQNGKDRSSPGDTQPPARQLGTLPGLPAKDKRLDGV